MNHVPSLGCPINSSSDEQDMIDILLPRTDGGVAVQLAILIGGYALGVLFLRRHRDWLLLLTGVAVLLLALFGVRALH